MNKIPIKGKIVSDEKLGNKVEWTIEKCEKCRLYYPSIKLKGGLCDNCQSKK